jgi:hypothetical protein
MIRQGGAFLISTPFLIKIHNYPVDCSRRTEAGLKYFLAEAGFDLDTIKTGAWGNRDCIKSNWKNWTGYRPQFHSLENETEFPVAVWTLARKLYCSFKPYCS